MIKIIGTTSMGQRHRDMFLVRASHQQSLKPARHTYQKLVPVVWYQKLARESVNLVPVFSGTRLDWIVQCFTSPPTQYRLYGRRFLQVRRPNQQYQSTEGDATKEKKSKQTTKTTKYIYPRTITETQKDIHKISTTSPLVYTNMGRLGYSSHRGQVC